MAGGARGAASYYATVGIQNIRRTPGAGQVKNAHEMAAANALGQLLELKKGISGIDARAVFHNEGPFSYTRNAMQFPAYQLTASYQRQGVDYRQWTVVVARPIAAGKTEGIVHVWSYAAPMDRFERYGPVAGRMMETWNIQ